MRDVWGPILVVLLLNPMLLMLISPELQRSEGLYISTQGNTRYAMSARLSCESIDLIKNPVFDRRIKKFPSSFLYFYIFRINGSEVIHRCLKTVKCK